MSYGRMYSNSTVVNMPYLTDECINQIIDWCQEYSRGEVEVHPISVGHTKVLFEFADDAVMFSLKWGAA